MNFRYRFEFLEERNILVSLMTDALLRDMKYASYI